MMLQDWTHCDQRLVSHVSHPSRSLSCSFLLFLDIKWWNFIHFSVSNHKCCTGLGLSLPLCGKTYLPLLLCPPRVKVAMERLLASAVPPSSLRGKLFAFSAE